MIENNNEVSKDLEKTLQALKQAQQRVANEKKKQNEKKRKAEVTYPPCLQGAHIPPEVVCALSEGQVSLAWTPAESVVCLATAKRGNDKTKRREEELK